MDIGLSKAVLDKTRTDSASSHAIALSKIWDEVVHSIVSQMLDLAKEKIDEVHINLREEIIFKLAKLQLALTEQVVRKRVSDRELSEIDVKTERRQCLGQEGSVTIENTAQICNKHIWLKLFEERWAPKTRAALEKEQENSFRHYSVNAADARSSHKSFRSG